ncbi:hypothetical protein [Loktanella sp. Alg231-35]|uniref:hypothetical protein n=1 Tax=Loktanella sp. Alg231-35 TaxID=1922220 RepID=UPI000D5539D7|nr:hypothetical protein [Loktanella sp. Alg231-35]
MSRQSLRLSALALSLVLLAGASAQAEDLSLLAPTTGTFERGLTLASRVTDVAALTDGDPATIASFDTPVGEPVDLVFRFPDGPVSPNRVELILSPAADDASPVRIDILVSTVSPTAGFRSLREEGIDPLRVNQGFDLRPAATGWLMLRLHPGIDTDRVALAEIAVAGHTGPPESSYAFGESPANALQLLEGLGTLEPAEFALSGAEREIFASRAEGMFDQRAFEEAALLASGVTNPAARQGYIARLDAIETAARNALDTEAPPARLGADLLAWLHLTVMTGGYVERQTDLSIVLDDGQFNCVSSAVLYAAIGRRLGLDVRAIEVPDHAFAIVYDGVDHMDVETTTPEGFDPQRERLVAFEELTGYVYIPESNRAKRREIGPAGLVALIYYNHGVEALRTDRYNDALLHNFRALSLDPEFTSAVQNALVALGKWSASFADSGQWEAATQVAALGTRLAPEDDGLVARERATWERWAYAVAEGGDAVEAIAILDRVATASPGADYDAAKAAVFLRPAEDLIKLGDWAAALEAAESGLLILDGTARTNLNEWRRGAYLRWTNDEIDGRDFAAAMDVLTKGLATFPDDARLSRSVPYLVQEAMRAAPDFAAGLAVLAAALDQVPEPGALDGVAETYVMRHVDEAARTAPMADALALTAQAIKGLAAAGVDDPDLGPRVYDIYGHSLIDAADWPAAAELYAAGRTAYPGDRLLSRNARYVAQEWRRSAYNAGGAVALAEIVARLRVLFPDLDSNQGENEIVRAISDALAVSHYDSARQILDAAQLVVSQDRFAELQHHIVDSEAQVAMRARDWPKAAQVYADARVDLADPSLFSNNVAYVAQQWTGDAAADSGAEGIVTVMSMLVTLFPGDAKVADMGRRAVRRHIVALVESGDVAAAEGELRRALGFLATEEVEGLAVDLYRSWGDGHLQSREWEAALRAYANGFAVVPASRDLRRNVPYVMQEWTASALASGGETGLIAAVSAIRTILPDTTGLQDVLEQIVARHVGGLVASGEAEAALQLVDKLSEVLADETDHEVRVYLYNQWARRHLDAEDWAAAVDVYKRGLADVGSSSLLENNLGYARSRL